ncbi:MAG: glucose-6-phosphate dehydrogenase, partial [Deltaproteobacteria bacterium]|nr:glucose-6-phosphate dehydrogenase [Deltaproteobacteria bacterium]
MAIAHKIETQRTGARPGDSCALVIFGAAGDLTKRLLVPSLYNLRTSQLLPKNFAVVGVTAAKFSDEEFREKLTKDIQEFSRSPIQKELWDWFKPKIYYQSGDFRDPMLYRQLKDKLAAVDKQQGTPGSYLFYLATAPQFFGEIIKQLGAAHLTGEENGVWRRVIVEKPFGRDLDSARALNKEIKSVLDESQIYRIDHYLGKETVQNMMVFRFGNGIFEPIWNRRYIDHVQITVGETVGVEQRGGYYDTAGALRDMIPNHTLQLVAMTAMEPPISFDSEAVRDEKAKVLHAIQPLSPEDVLTKAVRGQYGPGTLDGQPVSGYRSEPQVNPQSATESFVAMELHIDNWRWAGVPFYLRTGKRLAERATEIAIQFRRAPQLLFRGTEIESISANQLVMYIQPDEGISLRFSAKIPGAVMNLGAVNMSMKYQEYFGAAPWTGYETLLLDCMIGDPTLFQRADTIEAGWRVVQ